MAVCYPVILERGDTSYGSYVPDIPGCIAVEDTPEETLKLMQEALQEHISLMQEDGDAIPDPSPIHAIAYNQATETIHEVKVDLQDLGDVCNGP